ncbi:hypothetical protein Vadar_019239 [Vaccinium darrowii]|uniref:Uncharacterized protein n=1 Tax=Vaccinium darrowii TaxID=229202 RepID=A0ACB7Y8C2_9ERIC|nr:hypothetical protein Vadar_019239 [Vaccinium darrowii]
MGLAANPITSVVLLPILLSLLAAAATPVTGKLKPSHIKFDYFKDTYNYDNKLQLNGNATIHNDALQVTLDSGSPSYDLTNKAGRILYKHPFKLWDGQNGTRVGSFNASFLVNINRVVGNKNPPGEGLAFVVAPDLNLPPPNSSGKYLGLTNSTTDGNATNHLVAVELDTFKEDFDPDSNHVGLNINSVKSNITTPLGFQLVGANFFNFWVQYDGIEKVIHGTSGWCHKHGKLLLVYEYMPNLSLDKHLFSSDGNNTPLSWNLRCKIIFGVASALHYLHNQHQKRVIHRDLKASNIMLDAEFNARLGDFGLARALDNEKTSYAEVGGIPGTPGYIAPEYSYTGKATEQSDVYGFGAVLLEVVSGHRPGTQVGGYPSLVDWVWALHREGQLLEAVDNRLGEDNVAEEAQRVLLLGLVCSHPTASERPKTQEIVQMLSGSLPVPHVPPFRPPFMWASVPIGVEDINLVTTTSFTTSHYVSAINLEIQQP